VYGKVIDATSHKPLDYTTVSLLLSDHDSVITGMLTDPKGEFSMEHIMPGSYKIRVTYLGLKDYIKAITISGSDPSLDLGNINMEASATALSGVTIQGDRAAMTMSVDKKIFNVDKDISSRGGNAIDVMKNIPGISVDGDGNVTLRNNTPLIYVNGKPSSLTLDQIPSDQIDRVEIITNPSAKYEATASGGIVNVILKHDHKPGYNGMASLLCGTNNQYNATAQINFHQRKLGFSLSVNVSGATNRVSLYNNRTTLDSATHQPLGYYNQNNFKINQRNFQTIRGGIDYYISNRNTLSLSENIIIGKFSNDITSAISALTSGGGDSSQGINYNYEGVKRRTFNTTLDFKHTYPRAGKEYAISLSYERFYSSTDFFDSTDTYDNYGRLLSSPLGIFKQRIPSGISSHQLLAQWDFTHPMRDSIRLEYGLRSFLKYTNTFANVYDYIDTTMMYVSDIPTSSKYVTHDVNNAAYITISQQKKRFSYQLGLRFEEVYFHGTLVNKGQIFSYQYPTSALGLYESFFPSLILSERFNKKSLLQFNIARKTNRPSGGQINPNLEVIDKYDYTVGNSSLHPEFINQAELNFNINYSKLDWISSVYGKYTENAITNYTYDSGGILIQTYINATGKLNYGWENTIKLLAVKNLNAMLNANLFYTSIKAQPFPGPAAYMTNDGFSLTAKASISYKFPKGFSAQINGTYESPKPIPQGRNIAVYFCDLSASKDLGPVTLNLTVSDLLNSHIHGYEYNTDRYRETFTKRRESRYIRIGVVFKFGKEDAIQRIKKSKKDREDEGE
jgi:hypothetical protein